MRAREEKTLAAFEDESGYVFSWDSGASPEDSRLVGTLVGGALLVVVFAGIELYPSFSAFQVQVLLCILGFIVVVPSCFCARAWLSRRRVVDSVGRRASFRELAGLSKTGGGYRDVGRVRVHMDPTRVPVRHVGRLQMLCFPHVELLAENRP